MESVTGCRQQIKALRCELAEQRGALAALKEVFAQEAEHLRRHDQAQSLDALREKVAREVTYIRRMEAAASYGFNKGMLITGLVKFALGSALAAIGRTGEHPLSVGARWAQNDLTKTAPFGTVMVAVGNDGVPDDVSVVPLSRWARELNRSESQLATALESCGYRLMPPEDFSTVIDSLKEKVLKGVLYLPARASSLAQSADRSPQ